MVQSRRRGVGALLRLVGVSAAGFLVLVGLLATDDRLRADLAADSYIEVFLSSTSNGSVGGVGFADEDIVVYEPFTDSWRIHLDGSDVGLGGVDVNGFHVLDPVDPLSPILLTFQQSTTIADVGSVDDSDIVEFTPTAVGDATTGSFTMWLDGSGLGLEANGEDIDGLTILADGRLAISTVGSASVPATGGGSVSASDEDLLVLNADLTFERLVDSSDVGYSSDFTAAAFDDETGGLVVASNSAFDIDGLTGDQDDLLLFVGTTGDPTSGVFSVLFDGDEHGFDGENIDAAQTRRPTADLSVTVSDDSDPIGSGDSVTYTIEVHNAGPDPAVDVRVVTALDVGLELDASAGCADDPAGLVCELGDLAADAVVSYSLLVRSDFGVRGELSVRSSVTNRITDADPGNDVVDGSTTIEIAPTASDDASILTPVDVPIAGVDLRANDDLGNPIATVTSFGGGDLGGTVDGHAAGTTVAIAAGSVSVGADGALTFVPEIGFVGSVEFSYLVENVRGSSVADVVLDVGGSGSVEQELVLYLSSTRAGTVGGVDYDDEDVVAFDSETGEWSMFFDGSDVGLESRDLDALHIVDPDTALPDLLFSVDNPMTIDGFGPIDDSDVLRFTPTSLGETTSGTFSLWLDGSSVGLDTWDEDVDAVFTSSEGLAVVSTVGVADVPAPGDGVLSVGGSDLIALAADQTFSLDFDGSSLARPLVAAWSAPDGDTVHSSFERGLTLGGVDGDGDDVFVVRRSEGSTSAEGRVFDGDDHANSFGQIDAVAVGSVLLPTGAPPVIQSDGGGPAGWIAHPEDASVPGSVVLGSGLFSAAGDHLASGEATDASGNVFATGFYQGTVDFDPGAAVVDRTSAGGFDIFVSSFDADGVHRWTHSIGSAGDDRGAGVAAYDGGDVLVTGTFAGVVDFDPGVDIEAIAAVGVSDAFLARYDTAGSLVWVVSFGGADDLAGSGIAVDEDGTILSVDDFVTDLEASDADGDTEGGGLTWSFTTDSGGADNAAFSLLQDSGLLAFVTAPDFEAPADADADNDYEVEVTVTDSDGLTDTQLLTIRVTDAVD